MTRIRLLCTAALAVPMFAGAQSAVRRAPVPLPRTHAPKPTAAAITPADLMTRLYIFADDSMQGRETGTEGNRRALRYIEAELTRLGLTPMGDNGTFLQQVPLVKRGWNSDFVASAGGAPLTPWSDITPLPPRGKTRALDGVTVVYGGSAEDAAALTAEQVSGKIVVVTSPGGLRAPRVAPGSALLGANAIALLLSDPLPAQFVSFFRTPGMSVSDPVTAGDAVSPTLLAISTDGAQKLFGADVASLKPGQVGKALATNLSFTETPSPAFNVVAMIPGSDPVLKGQVVAIGAHNDHDGVSSTVVDHDSLRVFQRKAWTLAGAYAGLPELSAAQRASITVNVDSLHRLRPARRDSIYNGADDDGSGSMAVLEIAENVQRSRVKPKRSMLFVWHTGEEKGLLGSRWISEHLPVPLDSIVAQINIDMIGRGDSVDVKGGGPTYVGVVGAKRLSTMLGTTVDSIAKSYRTPLELDYRLDADGHPENIYCRSDHYHYARLGIPVAFFFTGLHGDYHQVTDEPQYIDYSHYSLLTNYIRDLLVTVGNGAKPVVDKPKPDPTGQCKQ